MTSKLLMGTPAAAGGGGGITFPITGVSAAYTGTQSPSFTLGTSPIEDDIIVAVVATDAGGSTITDASGWTNVLGPNVKAEADSMVATLCYHRVTSAEDIADQVTWTLTNLWTATRSGDISAVVLRGVATSGELVGSSSTFDSGLPSTWVIASVTPTADDCQIVAGLTGDSTQTQTTPSGWALEASGNSRTSNYVYSRDALGVNGVATGTTNVAASSGDEYVSIVACFAPA